MKTMAVMLIAMFVTITASAESWAHKIQRLENENKALKARIVQLEGRGKQTSKTSAQVQKAKPTGTDYVIKSTGKRAENIRGMLRYLEKYKKEKKEIEEKIKKQKYSLGNKGKLKKQKQIWLNQVAALEKKIKRNKERIKMFDVKQ